MSLLFSRAADYPLIWSPVHQPYLVYWELRGNILRLLTRRAELRQLFAAPGTFWHFLPVMRLCVCCWKLIMDIDLELMRFRCIYCIINPCCESALSWIFSVKRFTHFQSSPCCYYVSCLLSSSGSAFSITGKPLKCEYTRGGEEKVKEEKEKVKGRKRKKRN